MVLLLRSMNWLDALARRRNRPRQFVLLAMLGFLVSDHSAIAEEFSDRFFAPSRTFPEAMLVPIRFEGDVLPNAGWILSYRNGLRGPETPDREIETRRVKWMGTNGEMAHGMISWEITRTRNDTCASQTAGSCPDTIRVLSVPEGFIAVPEILCVNEGVTLQIIIVPSGTG